jgi:Bacterial Ig domain
MPYVRYAWVVDPMHGTKHQRLLYDSKRGRVVVGGGDRGGIEQQNSDNGNPSLAAWTPPGTTAIQLCDRAGPGMRPAYPDNHTLGYATVLDRYIAMSAFWFKAKPAELHPTKPASEWLMNAGIFDPNTNQWSATIIPVPTPPPGQTQVGWGGDTTTNFGFYDPDLNAMRRIIWDGSWGCSLHTIPLGDLVTFPLASCASVGAGLPSGFLRNKLRNTDAHFRQQVLDPRERVVYAIAQSQTRLDAADDGWSLIRVDLTDPRGASTVIDLPPTFVPPAVGEGGQETYLAFDTVRRLLISPMVSGYNGELRATLVCDVDHGYEWFTDTDQGTPNNRPVGNSCIFFPPTGEVVFVGGRRGANDQSILHPGEALPIPTHYSMFTPSTTPLPPATGNAELTITTGPIQVPLTEVPAFYRTTRREPGSGTIDQTVDTPNYATRVVTYNGLLLNHPYEFRTQLRSAAAAIGAEHVQVITFQGTDPEPPDPPVGDTTPPVITIVYPANLQEVKDTITFQVTVTDASGILKTEYRVNGVLLPGPSFDTKTLPNGNATLQVYAEDNSTAHNPATATRTFVINNVPPDPPDPPIEPDPPRAVFLDAEGEFSVAYVLWANVPLGFESRFKQKYSRWPLATDEEVALIEAGRVAEKFAYLDRLGTDAEMQAALQVEWQKWNTEVQAVSTWNLLNAVWDGTGWNTRG